MEPIFHTGGFTGGNGVFFIGESSEVFIFAINTDLGPPFTACGVPIDTDVVARVGIIRFLVSAVFLVRYCAKVSNAVVCWVVVYVVDLVIRPRSSFHRPDHTMRPI